MKTAVVMDDDARLLMSLKPEERTACRLLTQYPLYKYTAHPKRLDVLLVGHGRMAEQMLRDAAWCGQMPGWELTIHTTHESERAVQDYEDALNREMPMLQNFSNIGGAAEREYVRFDMAVLEEVTAERIVERFPDSRWILVDLNDEEQSAALAYALALRIADPGTVILYEGDCAMGGLSGLCRLVPCYCEDEEARRTTRQLARMAADIDWFYTRRRDPFASRKKQREKFVSGDDAAYFQRSSLPPALFGYKLWSVGIDPEWPHADIAEKYASCVLDNPEGYTRLVFGEHRRWLMNKVMAGFRLPTERQLREECFTLDRYRFNSGKLHNCMVTSDASCRQLSTLSREEWEQFRDWESIDRTDLDELDKVSLKCHLLAHQMLQESVVRQEERLQKLRHCLEAGGRINTQKLRIYHAYCGWHREITHTGKGYRAAQKQRDALRALLDMGDEAANRLYCELCRETELAYEYYRYRDYKAGDRDMVEQLPWLYCRPERLVLIKLGSRYMMDNIAPTLLLEPDLAVYMDVSNRSALKEFFRERGGNADLRFVDTNGEFGSMLELLLDEFGSDAVIDLTGAPDLEVAKAVLTAEKHGVGLIRCDSENQRVINVHNFPLADVVRKHLSLRADEVFRLYGGRAHLDFTDARSVSVYELQQTVSKLMGYYSNDEGHQNWKTFATVVTESISGSKNNLFYVQQNLLKEIRESQEEWVCYEGSISAKKAQGSNLIGVLTELDQMEQLIADFTCKDEDDEFVFSFRYPPKLNQHFGDFFTSLRNVQAPLLALRRNANYISVVDMHKLTFSFSWAARAKRGSAQTKAEKERLKKEREQFESTVGFLKAENLLEETPDAKTDAAEECYTFANPSMMLCAGSIGGLLEACTAISAMDMMEMDDVRLGYTIHWGEEGEAYNELDIVAVSGLRMAVLSCKDTKPKASDLMEVAYIASSFSCNSRAMLVTTHRFSKRDEAIFNKRAEVSGVKVVGWDGVRSGRLRGEIGAMMGIRNITGVV